MLFTFINYMFPKLNYICKSKHIPFHVSEIRRKMCIFAAETMRRPCQASMRYSYKQIVGE